MMNMYVAFVTVMLATVISVAYGEEPITVINNISDFKEFRNNVNKGTNDYSSTTVYLDASLNFNGSTIEPVGNDNNPFRGTFDGQGHTISNFTISTTSSYAGLFGHAQGATIMNVTLGESCSVTSTASGDLYIGSVCGYCKGKCTIERCVNFGKIYTEASGTQKYIGGILGYCGTDDCKLKNNTNYGTITCIGDGIPRVGGIVGESAKELTVNNCINFGNIAVNSTGTQAYVGGTVGFCSLAGEDYKIKNSINYGTITYAGGSEVKIGGIVGESVKELTVSGCTNFGSINAELLGGKGWISGIAGTCVLEDDDSKKEYSLKRATNYGDISINGSCSTLSVGGIAGYFSGTNSYIQSCHNFGTINNTCECTERSYIGGIAGGGGSKSGITECISDGMIEDTSSSGGLSIGAICPGGSSTISECYYNNKSLCNDQNTCLNQGSSYNESFYINETCSLSDIIGTSQNAITNTNGFTLTLNVNCENTTTISTKFIVLPSTTEWYNDSDYLTLFNAISLNESTTIYGRFGTYPETCGSSSSSSSSSYSSSSSSSPPLHTSSSSSSSSSITFTPSTSSSTTSISPTDNATEYVKIVFNKKDLTETEVSDIITKIAGGSFTIERMNTEDNNLMVIVKFENAEAARNFVEFIEGTGNEDISYAMLLNDPSSLAPTSASTPKAIVYFFSFIYLLKC